MNRVVIVLSIFELEVVRVIIDILVGRKKERGSMKKCLLYAVEDDMRIAWVCGGYILNDCRVWRVICENKGSCKRICYFETMIGIYSFLGT